MSRSPHVPLQPELFGRQPPPEGSVVTVDGEVTKIVYSNDETGFRVLRLTPDGSAVEKALVGVFPLPTIGARVRATGRVVKDPKHGDQFRVETMLTVAPATLAGLEKFLGSGFVPGIGGAFARKIVETFGEDTLEVLDHDPARLREVAGLGQRRAQQVEKAWEAHRVVGAIMIFLQSHGASAALASRIYKRFGPRAVSIVSASPYRLALDVWGIGFKTADRIANSLGIKKDAPERAQAGLLHVLHERSTQGHVFVERDGLLDEAMFMLEIERTPLMEALEVLGLEHRVVVDGMVAGLDGTAVYLPALHHAETTVASRLAELAVSPIVGTRLEPFVEEAVKRFELTTSVVLADTQREALRLAASKKVVVITGGPGVGKTTIVRALLMLFDRAGLKTRLAAPTGRAAKRMAEATRRDALTLHRLLEFDPMTRGFTRDDAKPLELGALVVDESSMVDIELMASVLIALPQQARLVLVGDVDQLPSVGAGAVLRDVIASNVIATVRLTEIFRQAAGSLIVENAHRINTGQAPISDRGQGGAFYLFDRKSDEAAADCIVELVTERIPRGFSLQSLRDVQVLTPMHKGASGTIAMNERLQAALNPVGPQVTIGQRVLRLGDKVMQLKNDYEREVYNGDLGFITRVDAESRKLIVSFDDREVICQETDLEELTLAYAISIHKSQGSEYPAVVIPFTMNHFVMLSRNLLYTAVTRGKKLVIVAGDPRAIGLSLAETRKEQRATGLTGRLAASVGAG